MIIKVDGLPPFNGEHALDPPFNAREWRIIKQTSGALPTTLMAAVQGGDPDVVVALVMIALRRKGQVVPEELIMDNYFPGDESGQHAIIEIDFSDEQGDAVPPPSPPNGPEPKPSSGTYGSDAGATRQASDPSSTGMQPSDTGPDSDPPISAT